MQRPDERPADRSLRRGVKARFPGDAAADVAEATPALREENSMNRRAVAPWSLFRRRVACLVDLFGTQGMSGDAGPRGGKYRGLGSDKSK